MARITVEDCLKNVENRFDLVLKASKRAHLLELGAADPQVPLDNDKPTVVALREIAAGMDITKTRVTEESEASDVVDATSIFIDTAPAEEGVVDVVAVEETSVEVAPADESTPAEEAPAAKEDKSAE